MKKELNNLDRLKGKNPFTVPDGYMEGLTSRVMDRLPEKKYEVPRKVTVGERIRPWAYLAAVFAGLGLFFRVLVGFDGSDQPAGSTTDLLVQSYPSQTLSAIQSEEDEEYLEYIESQYASYILAEEMANYE